MWLEGRSSLDSHITILFVAYYVLSTLSECEIPTLSLSFNITFLRNFIFFLCDSNLLQYIIYILSISLIISAYRLIGECWNENPAKRPTFRQIITRLESIYNTIGQKRRWKVIISLTYPLNPLIKIFLFTYQHMLVQNRVKLG